MTAARLVSASATTGWRDWIHGQLWLLNDGLLRVATDLATTIRHGANPTVPGDEAVTADISRHQAEGMAGQHRRNVWVPREHIKAAVLRGGRASDSLRLQLYDGSTVTLLWRRQDAAYGPIKQALESWIGPALELKGRRRPPNAARSARSSRAALLIGNLIPVLLLVGLYAGSFDGLLDRFGGSPDRGCDELSSFADRYPEGPEPGTLTHPLASQRTQTHIDRALQPFLLDEVADGSHVPTHENFWDLNGHADMQHNPAARDLAVAHGFVRQVSRQWTDEDGNHILHIITQVSSPRNAASFNFNIARYSCRFAEELRPVPIDPGDPPGIGQRVLYRGGAVAEQVSWTRDGRRHLLVVHDQTGQPSRELLQRLLARAYPRDNGNDVLMQSPSSDAGKAG
ncbi:MAG: hypothetical protein M3O70_27000 [Actinomycetota bacterium]|nr:hypothetical protein [Actinomycetota bacterium]